MEALRLSQSACREASGFRPGTQVLCVATERYSAAMNMMQRVGVFAVLICFMAILVAHAPWAGYVSEIPGTTFPNFPQANSDATELPFLEWRSQGAMFFWFLTVRNVCIALLLLSVALIVWLFLFRTRR